MYSVGFVKLTEAWRLKEVLLEPRTVRLPTAGIILGKPPCSEIAAMSSASVRDELGKVNGSLTFYWNYSLCRHVFDYELSQNG